MQENQDMTVNIRVEQIVCFEGFKKKLYRFKISYNRFAAWLKANCWINVIIALHN